MKRIIIFLMAFSSTILVSAQSVLSFGVRGGSDLLIPKSEQTIKPKMGLAGNFDIGYTYYWKTRGSGEWGIHTGASVGYANNMCQITFSQQYTNYDYMSNEMLYTTSGKVNVMRKRAYAEIPLMAAFRSRGFVMQIGPKVQYSFWNSAAQRIEESNIDAYYVPFDVHVTNEVITGVVSGKDLEEKMLEGGTPTFNILAALSLGYETRVGNQSRIGIMAYVDYNVWNTLSIARIDQPFIAVAPIMGAANPVPAVKVNNAFSSFISGINPLQIGISLYFGIEFEQQYNRSYRRPRTYRSNLRYNPYAFKNRSNRYRPYYSRHRR